MILKIDGDILKLCDELRDDVLPFLGVQLGDKEGEEAVVKFVDKEVLLKEREARLEVGAFEKAFTRSLSISIRFFFNPLFWILCNIASLLFNNCLMQVINK